MDAIILNGAPESILKTKCTDCDKTWRGLKPKTGGGQYRRSYRKQYKSKKILKSKKQ
jgi:hypothetical protein